MPYSSARSRERILGFVLIFPAVLVLLMVFAYPIFRAIWLGIFSQSLGTQLKPIFVGGDNYLRILGDSHFWQSFWITGRFTLISVTIEVILGICIALILNQPFRGRSAVRTIAIIPWAIPTALIALGWSWIFNDQYGIANEILLRLGVIKNDINWLGEPASATLALIISDVWKTTPFISILFLAGLQSISEDLYEAYGLDGAKAYQKLFHITLPLLMPQILIAVLFRFAQAFGIFDLVKVMTSGGPGGSTEVISLYIYNSAMRYLDFGYASSLVVVTFLILVSATILCLHFLNRQKQHIQSSTRVK